MGRMSNLSPLGLYNWDSSLFDLMYIPEQLDKNTLIANLLAETSELEVIYPNPVVLKNLIGVWSAKQLDIWNRLYATTQYEYDPIENYNRYETGSDGTTGRTTHSGTDTTADTTTYGGTDARIEATMHGGTDGRTESTMHGGTDGHTESTMYGGTDTITTQNAEGGTQGEQSTGQLANGGTDSVTGTSEKGHWIAGYDSTASGQSDGLVKQTRDQDDGTTTTRYGKTESSSGSSTTTFGKTESGTEATAYGKTENVSETSTYGKTENVSETNTYGKTENVSETRTYGQSIQRAGNMTHGEQIDTTNTGTRELHAHGNIGVTTTQEMIKQQRNIERFNLYDIIIEDFKMRFCILVY